jgi:hypothetical protein
VTTEELASSAPAVAPSELIFELNATHRCDRCNAQAYHLALIEREVEGKTQICDLLLCNHHRQVAGKPKVKGGGDPLVEQALFISDQSEAMKAEEAKERR